MMQQVLGSPPTYFYQAGTYGPSPTTQHFSLPSCDPSNTPGSVRCRTLTRPFLTDIMVCHRADEILAAYRRAGPLNKLYRRQGTVEPCPLSCRRPVIA